MFAVHCFRGSERRDLGETGGGREGARGGGRERGK